MVTQDRRITAALLEGLVSTPEIVSPRPLVMGFEGLPIAPLAIPPDWVESVELTTSWRTDVTVAKTSNVEDRRGLLSRPTRSLTVTVTGRNTRETHVLAQSLMGYAWANAPAPLYCDQTYVLRSEVLSGACVIYCDTRWRRFFIGQRVLLQAKGIAVKQRDNFVQWAYVSVVNNDSLVLTAVPERMPQPGDLVVPCMDAEVSPKQTGTFVVDTLLKVRLTWEETAGPESIPATHPLASYDNLLPFVAHTEDGIPIFDFPADWSDGLKISVNRRASSDSVGRSTLTETDGQPYHDFQTSFLCPTREVAWGVIRFFDSMRGRVGQFYLLHPNDPWVLWAPLPFNNSTACNINAIGSHEEILLHYTHVAFTHADGRVFVRKLDDVDDVLPSGDHYRLTWTEPLTDYAGIIKIRPIHLCRLNDDSMTENWETDGVCRIDLNPVEMRTFDNAQTPTPENLLHFSSSRDRTAITLSNPQFWFDAGSNVYAATGLGSFVLADPWPSRRSAASLVFDARESLPTLIPADVPANYPRLIAPFTYPGLMRFSEIWQNNNARTLASANFRLSQHDSSQNAYVPLDQQHLWSNAHGWTLILCITPFSVVPNPGVESCPVEVLLPNGTPVFQLIAAHYLGGVIGAGGVRFLDSGGATRTQGFVNTISNIVRTRILVVHFDPATSRLYVHLDGASLLVGGYMTVTGLNLPAAYGSSAWGHGLTGVSLPPSTSLAGAWAVRAALNTIINYRRALAASEVNAIGHELALMYNGVWTDLTY